MDFVENVGRRSRVDVSEVGRFVDLRRRSLNGYERNALFRNVSAERGTPHFVDSGYLESADRIEDGRAAASIDIDGDGDLDVVVQSYQTPAVLLVNRGRSNGHWLRVRLRGQGANTDAIGARVVAFAGGRQLIREVATSQGYLAGQSLACHFGLGDAERVDRLDVHWPSGRMTVLHDLEVDRALLVDEGGKASAGGSPER